MSLQILFGLLIPVGLFLGAFFGSLAGRKMIKTYKWTPFIIACVLLTGMMVVAILTGGELSDSVRPVLATILGFTGGLLYVTRENIYR